MIIVDTSAWVEYLRRTSSPTTRRVRKLVEDGDGICVPEVVIMELGLGPTDEARVDTLIQFLHQFDVVSIEPLIDTHDAAALYRRCRRGGQTVRSVVDCLIAAVAIRLDMPVLHRDRDFDVIARHAPLQIA